MGDMLICHKVSKIGCIQIFIVNKLVYGSNRIAIHQLEHLCGAKTDKTPRVSPTIVSKPTTCQPSRGVLCHVRPMFLPLNFPNSTTYFIVFTIEKRSWKAVVIKSDKVAALKLFVVAGANWSSRFSTDGWMFADIFIVKLRCYPFFLAPILFTH